MDVNAEHLHRLGYWLVDGEPCFNKVLSAVRATELDTRDIRFYFNDHIYSAIDWRVPVPASIETLYEQRALQLREKYQHLVVLYSGGSDSGNALKAMLKAGIMPDEVVYHWAGGATSQNNLANAEIIHAAWNMLNYLHREHNIPITCFDEYDLYSKHGFDSDTWVLEADAVLNPCTYPRYKMLQDHPEWNLLVDRGHKVGLVMGIDKPRILWDNGRWHGVFLDTGFQHNFTQDHMRDSGISIEGFYCSPDAPLITVKQSQMLRAHLDQIGSAEYFQNNFSRQRWNSDLHSATVRQVCYPYWDDRTFSIGKSHVIYDRKHLWWLQGNTELKQNYFAGLDWIDKNVDQWWLNKNTAYEGMRGIFSRTYELA